MARSFNGTSDFLQSASALSAISGKNYLAIGFWVKTTFAADDDMLLELSANANSNAGGVMILGNESGANKVLIKSTLTSTQAPESQFTAPSDNVWHHLLFDMDLASPGGGYDYNLFIDGVAQTRTAGANISTAGDTFGSYVLNVMSRNGASLFADGALADLCIWNPATPMTAVEAGNLAAGARANTVRSGEILYYWPLSGTSSPEPASVGGISLNVTGSVQTTDPDAFSSAPLSVNAGADQAIYTGQVANISATASGGSGTKTYAWTKTSGPSGTFGSTSAATTTFTPAAAGTFNLRCTVTDASGSATDDMQIVVTSPTASATVDSVTTDTSWTKEPTGSTSTSILADADGATYLTSTANPVNQVLTVVLQPITQPAAGVDLVVTLTADALDAGSATLDAYLYEGATLRSTVLNLPVPAGTTGSPVTGAVTVTFPAADVASVTSWTSGLTVSLEVTAAV